MTVRRHIGIYLLFFTVSLLPRDSHQGANERRLLQQLFATQQYNKLERPVKNESQALPVLFGITLQQIIDVNEKQQILHSNIWLQMKWNDSNLAWNPEEFGGIEVIRVPPSKIWKPDILMYNSADEAFDGTYPTNVVISSDGACLWVPPGMFKSTCQIDITWFPFDDQKCLLKFGSWTHDGHFLDLQLHDINGGDTTSFIRNGEWQLIGVPAELNIKKYNCCSEFYMDATYTVHIRRRTLYYGFNILIPCVLISCLSLLLFILPPDAGEKISLGVTILLSLMVFLLLVAETMPPTSDAVPLIGIYFACIMVMCSISVVLTVIVLNYHHRSSDTHVMPRWVKSTVCYWLAWALRIKRPGHETHKKHSVQSARTQDLRMIERSSKSLLTNVLDIEDDVRFEGANGGVKTRAAADDALLVSGARGDLLAIFRELQKITAKLRRKEEEDDVKSDWKFAAMVIDRLCLIICFLFTGISTLTILMSAPHLVA